MPSEPDTTISAENQQTNNNNADKKKFDKDSKDKPEELSEEDLALKEGLELAVQRLMEEGVALHEAALNHLSNEIKSATSSMTSVPKPLKFLRPHYESLKIVYNRWEESHAKKPLLADVLSVLAMTMAEPGSRECLRFKLLGTVSECSAWGHEYIRCLAGEISEEFNVLAAAAEESLAEEEYIISDELMALVEDIVPFQMHHNAEAEAVDLLMEIRQLGKLIDSPVVDEKNFERVCLYLLRSAAFVYDADDLTTLYNVIFHLYKTQGCFTDALRVALKMNDDSKVRLLFDLSDTERDTGVAMPSLADKMQMALILGRHRSHIVLEDTALELLVSNQQLSQQFKQVARSMDLTAAKSAEDIVNGPGQARKSKSPTDPFAALLGNSNNNNVESAKGNLSLGLINAFVNAAHDSDMYVHNTSADSSNNNSNSSSAAEVSSSSILTNWLSRNRGSGLTVAAASVGLVSMWNVDEGLNRIDPLLYHEDVNVKAGAVLAIGLMHCGVRDEADAAFALLSDYLSDDTTTPTAVRQAAILGLGICYAGSRKEEVKEVLDGVLSSSGSIAEASLAAAALGLVFAGTADDDLGTSILQRVMEASETDLDQPVSRLLVLGLGLLFLCRGEAADAFLEAMQVVEHRRGPYGVTTLRSCAYATSGNVLEVQELLRLCAEHSPVALSANLSSLSTSNVAKGGAARGLAALSGLLNGGAGGAAGGAATAAASATESKDDPQLVAQSIALGERQGSAVLGIALVAMGEEVGCEMSLRSFDHLLQYGDLAVRRSVPLALALLHLSQPEYAIIDQLSRLSHDADLDTAMAAVLALGLISAGTNNSRVATLLRQLAEFYAKEAQVLSVVRIAQGFNGLGKGLLSLSPFHSDRLLLQTPALAAILVVLHLALDMNNTFLSSGSTSNSVSGQPQWLFVLAAAMAPRYLHTVAVSEGADQPLAAESVSVRVGLAVETVGQAGRPKTITGFQTHTTPVLLGPKDRAEMASRDFKAVSSTMEGIVIVEKVEEKEL